MKFFTLLLGASFFLVAFIRSNQRVPVSYTARQLALDKKSVTAVTCSPDLNSIDFDDSSNSIPLLSGWGSYRMPVTAANDSARIYFEQGINMYYAFHVIEAMASFEKSTRLDTNFAMGYWGKALAYGPNINDNGYSASPAALIAMNKAKTLDVDCTAVEKGLIDAMLFRYAADSSQSREILNQRYADAMKKNYALFPESDDAGVLYADALMVQHPWNLYEKNYLPKSWTPEIVQTLEKILQRTPDHPGAEHYYIHAVEASEHPEKAMAVSKRLPVLMPGVSHVVHMPSHIFIRSGYYSRGEAVNEKAVKGYYDYLGKFPAVINNYPLYLIHNLHMQATCANMDGRFRLSMTSSVDCKNSFDSSMQAIPDYMGIFIQYVYMTPYLTLIRFGKWNEILHTSESPSAHVYASLLWHYGQGLAYARKHLFKDAVTQLEALQLALKADQLSAPAPSYANPGIAGAQVAEKILQGVIAEEQHKLPESIHFLQQAVGLEDSMVYNEPKDWVHPARQYLGNVFLKAKRYSEASIVYRQDLHINPNNGWSLTGLAAALAGEGKKSAATEIQLRAAKAFARVDTPIKKSVF